MNLGKLELPLPEIGTSLDASAMELQARIRERVPEKLRASVVVKAFRRADRTGLEISYDDSLENIVYSAIEYPSGSGREESVAPKERKR